MEDYPGPTRHYTFIWKPPYDPQEIARLPILAGHYREMPQEFIAAIKKKTGLKGYELKDYIDLLMFDIFRKLRVERYIRITYRQQAERRAKRDLFRKYFFIVMACLIFIPIIIVAVKVAVVAYTTGIASGMSTIAAIGLGIQVFVGSIQLSFKAFLLGIEFSTWVGVHKIAYLVSDEYRSVIRKVYGEITKVSSALGYGPYFLVLALQNTRNLVLDVSTSLGMRYDMAEVQWLSTFQTYMKNFAGATYRYKNNPEALFFDLARWVERDALDTKGAFIEGIVKTVEKATETITDTIEQVVVIRDDLTKLVMDLPENIRSQVEPYIIPYIEKFDTFITETYDPYKAELDEVISYIRIIQDSQRLGMTDLVDRLKKPADFILEIDNLSDMDKLDQEEKLDDISSRAYKRKIADFSEAVAPITAELKSIAAIKVRPIELAFMGVEEITAPVPVPIGEIDKTKTWFIGNY